MTPNVISVTLKTNKNSTSTNLTTTTKSSFDTKSVLNKDMLKITANSLTNLPPGITNGQLVTDGNGDFFVVLSNVIYGVAAVLRLSSDDGVVSGSETVVTKLPLPGTVTSESESATATQVATLTYDDTGHGTGDGKHTIFKFQGLLVTKYGDKTTSFTTSFTLTGQGDGFIDDKYVVLSGTVTGKITGDVDLDNEGP